MSQRWRIIDVVDHDGEITTGHGRIVAQGQEIPLADVACILTGSNTRWSGAVVAAAATYEIPILACDWRGIPHSVTMPWSSNSRVATRHHAQCDLSEPRKKNAWMQVVRAKVLGQASNLSDPSRGRLMELARQVRSGDPQNIEARAARTYWSRVFPGEDFKRDRLSDGRNACLNYGYSVLRGCVVRAICTAGLLPTLGIYHRNRSNAFGLADDLIEPFRPAVDFMASQLPPDASPQSREVKAHLVATLSQFMGREGVTVGSSINDLAQRFAVYVEGDTDRLAVPAWTRADG